MPKVLSTQGFICCLGNSCVLQLCTQCLIKVYFFCVHNVRQPPPQPEMHSSELVRQLTTSERSDQTKTDETIIQQQKNCANVCTCLGILKSEHFYPQDLYLSFFLPVKDAQHNWATWEWRHLVSGEGVTGFHWQLDFNISKTHPQSKRVLSTEQIIFIRRANDSYPQSKGFLLTEQISFTISTEQISSQRLLIHRARWRLIFQRSQQHLEIW